MLLQLSRIQCSAQLFARTFGLTMDDGEEDEQIANEGKGEETGSQNEEEKHIGIKAHSNVAKHEIIEDNVLKQKIINGNNHWNEEANGNYQF